MPFSQYLKNKHGLGSFSQHNTGNGLGGFSKYRKNPNGLGGFSQYNTGNGLGGFSKYRKSSGGLGGFANGRTGFSDGRPGGFSRYLNQSNQNQSNDDPDDIPFDSAKGW